MKNSMKEDKFEEVSQEVEGMMSMSKKGDKNGLEMIEDQWISLAVSLS